MAYPPRIFEVIGRHDNPKNRYITLYLIQPDEEVQKNPEHTAGRMALSIAVYRDHDRGYNVGDTVPISISMKYKRPYIDLRKEGN